MSSPLKSLLLFSLATSSAIPEENDFIATGAPNAPAMTYAQLLWRLEGLWQRGYQHQRIRLQKGSAPAFSSIRSVVARLQSDGMVSTFQKEGGTRVRLTSVGREALLTQIPSAAFRRKKWDERWRLVIFSGVRNPVGIQSVTGMRSSNSTQPYQRLRKTLLAEGFVALERGVYISPFPLSQITLTTLAKSRALGLLTGLETRRFVFGDEREFVRQVWNLDLLAKDYTKLRTRIVAVLRGLQKENGLTDTRKRQFSDCSVQMLQMLQADPGLPQQILPTDFPALPCWTQFLALAGAVARK